MKSISKAMIAVMIAAAMCVVPLFVIEDADAATLTTADKGVSFEAGSISTADFNKLFDASKRKGLCYYAIEAVVQDVDMDELTSLAPWTITGDSISEVRDVKLAHGEKITEDSIKTANARAITCDVEFTATFNATIEEPYQTLFYPFDGTQNLYKELKTFVVTDGTILTFKGTMTIDASDYSEQTIVKNTANDYVVTKGIEKNSMSEKFDGTVNFNNGDVNKKITWKSEATRSTEATIDVDFDKVDPKDATSTTKVINNTKTSGGSEGFFDYTVGDVSGSYSAKVDAAAAMGGLNMYDPAVADVYTGTISAPDFYYYSETGSMEVDCLFNLASGCDTTLRTDSAMKTFLEGIGSVGSDFGAAENVSNNAYTAVNAGGSSGGNNIIFYVIIGVLAVAVVALAVLLIKKK